MNQLFIVVGMLIGQALSLPLSHYGSWRWVFAVSIILGVVQLLGSLLVSVPTIKKDAKRVANDERAPLLGSGELQSPSLIVKKPKTMT